MCKIAEKCQYARRAGCAFAHNFRKYPGCALIGACALIRTNTVNHDNHHDESKTRPHRLSKLSDGPFAPNNLLTPEQKKNSLIPVGQATDKKLRPQPPKMNSFKLEPSKSLAPDPPACN